MGNKKKYWTGIDELKNTPAFREAASNEFVQTQSVDEFLSDEKLTESNTGRRDFLKFMGFSLTAATLAACEAPVIKSIPYVNKPQEITPGVANYYASSYYDGNDFANVLVKTREGRPIFIKGNKDFGLGKGAINARINASVLELYDSARLNGPRVNGESASWAQLDNAVIGGLHSANGSTVLLSHSVISPSTKRAIAEFTTAHNAKHVTYDSISYNGIRKAHEATHGKSVLPRYNFGEAKVIVGLGCDFLGTFQTSNVFLADYSSTRKPEGDWMSKHYQFETTMTLTGSNSDVRVPVTPSEEAKVTAALYSKIVGGSSVSINPEVDEKVKEAAADLMANKGNGLLISGSNDPNVQMLVNAVNVALNNYNTTLDIDTPSNLWNGDDAAMESLVNDMKAGRVKALIIYGCNPAYDWYKKNDFAEGLAKVETSVSFGLFADETGTLCKYDAPDHHYLESWNDLNAFGGRIDLVQPTISPLYKTRQAQESLLLWSGNNTDYYTYLRQSYNPDYSSAMMAKDKGWHTALHNGTMDIAAPEVSDLPGEIVEESTVQFDASSALASINQNYKSGSNELVVYQKVGIGNGAHAANPWLQELPDPITKVTWDDYIAMSPMDMEEQGYPMTQGQNERFDVVKVSVNGASVTLPVFPVPGQKRGTIGVSLGYGRGANQEKIGKAGFQTGKYGDHLTDDKGNKVPIGANAFGFGKLIDGCVVFNPGAVNIERTGEVYAIATTQMHGTIMGRDSIVKETTLAAFMAEKGAAKGEASWNPAHTLVTHAKNEDGSAVKKSTREFDMWHAHPVENVGHRWGMTIDLNSCTGCSACVTACHIENNVPVVGKDEVRVHRDMHWMRIDRFFASKHKTLEETREEEGLGTVGAYRNMERAAENPETVHMPMMCQHCNHAPCETVCPVAATTHSNEGLNQMTYNRCIGTRYCANNCPYKVRRFNWFNYAGYKKFKHFNPSQDSITRMVLNPDVVVRSRGVMEKCSLCVHRIQSGKLEAKKNSEPVVDGAIVSACAEACPTNAITFGDLNDNAANVRAIANNNRSYHALEEVGIQPNIFYMTKVRNNNEA